MRISNKQFASAVIDRIVDGITAVLLVEGKEGELLMPLEDLPPGSIDGQWLLLEMEDDLVIAVTFDEEKTREVKERISNKRALLLERMARGRRRRS